MINYHKLIRGQKVKVNVVDKTIALTTQKGKVVKFVADGKDCFIKYNTGSLGAERVVMENGVIAGASATPKDFVNGNTYNVNYYNVCAEKKYEYTNDTADYYNEVFIELKDDEGYYSDILLHSDSIAIYVDGIKIEKQRRRVFAGFYKRYDGMPFFVIDVVRDLETKREVVICKHERDKMCGYFTLTMDEFCAKIEVDGKKIKKYYRNNNRSRALEEFCRRLESDGYPTPVRRNEPRDRHYRQVFSYLEYAKDLCKNYNEDLRIYKLCMEMKRLIEVRSKEDFSFLKEDILFVNACLKTTLKEYFDFFKEHIVEKQSLRKYAEVHGLNRGSVEYLHKKFLAALAENLQKRDETDGVRRILPRNRI